MPARAPTPHLRTALLVLCALLPLALTGPRLVAGMRGACLASDYALLELSTADAAHGAQRLGPYSRFGWRHPGPACFYLLAPLYRLSGGNSASLPLGALAINWASVLAMAAMLLRRETSLAAAVLALALALAYGAYLGPGFVYSPWNPSITVLPFGVLVLLCSELAGGEPRALPWLATVGSFLVQTHVGYLPAVVSSIAVALGLWIRGLRRGESGFVPRSTVTLTLGALALLWALPLAEEWARSPGNLSAIARFFLRAEGGHSLGEALAITSREMAWPLSYAFFGARNPYASYSALTGARLVACAAFVIVQTALLAAWAFGPGERRHLRALARICLVCTLAAVPAMMRVQDEIRPYVATWISMVGTLGTLAALVPLLPQAANIRPMARDVSALVLVGGLAVAFAWVGRPMVHDSEFPPARAMCDRVVAALHDRGTHRPQVVIQTRSPEVFYAASAVLLQMHKRGIAFAVDRPWWSYFGEHWRPNGAEDDTLDFRSAGVPGDRPIVCDEGDGIRLCIGVRPRATTLTGSAGPGAR